MSSPSSSKAEVSAFLLRLDSYSSTLPEEVTAHLLRQAGTVLLPSSSSSQLPSSSSDHSGDRITKLFSLAADKFLAEVLYEAKQISLLMNKKQKQKTTKGSSSSSLKRDAEEASCLTLEALASSLRRKKVAVSSRRLRVKKEEKLKEEAEGEKKL